MGVGNAGRAAVAGAGGGTVGGIDMGRMKRTRGPAIFASPRGFLPNGDRSNYLTVITPFMFMARCGVQ